MGVRRTKEFFKFNFFEIKKINEKTRNDKKGCLSRAPAQIPRKDAQKKFSLRRKKIKPKNKSKGEGVGRVVGAKRKKRKGVMKK